VGVDEVKLYSRDENLRHISYEGGPLEGPAFEPERCVSGPVTLIAPDEPEYVTIGFADGVPVSVNEEILWVVELLSTLRSTRLVLAWIALRCR
jgi:argininosuccinate synthase